MAKAKGKTKKELLNEQIAAVVGAGREVAVETVDFSDPNRPKTCLEVDFPIIPINRIAAIEGKGSGALKPIYQVTKWWARRRSTVFRAMLLAAASKVPTDESKAAKSVWEIYYSDHQKRGSLRHLKVADPFMGGGTTIVEGSRLGMQMFGCDLNPVAWFVVKNEIEKVDIAEVKKLLADIEADVKPQIMPYFACDGPNGEKGKWFQRKGTQERKQAPVQLDLGADQAPFTFETEDLWEILPPSFDIFTVPWQERSDYRYEGPEIIYTFWAKHAPCQREGCGHRTPIMSTPVVAAKSISVAAWHDYECTKCGKTFDVETHSARMAPDSPLFIAPDERKFAIMSDMGQFICPHCGEVSQDALALSVGSSQKLGKVKNKKIELTLLVHPEWFSGCPKHDKQGREYGGSATDDVDATERWIAERASKLRLLEVRGNLPEQVTCPTTGVTFYTTEKGGTIPKRSTFSCAVDGTQNDVLESIKQSGKMGPLAPYAAQATMQQSDGSEHKFFTYPSSTRQWKAVLSEWEERRATDLKDYWPTSEVPYGFMTHHLNGGIPNHGFTHWWKMFNSRQLLVHSLLLKALATNRHSSRQAKLAVLGVFQQYLRNNNLFCFWNSQRALEPMFSNNNFHPKSTVIESSVFTGAARGDFAACAQKLLEAEEWCESPWEIATSDNEGHSDKVQVNDKVLHDAVLRCCSASAMPLPDSSYDLVVTDPPFGGLLHYAELADFFYVWLRLVLKNEYPEHFTSEYTPKALEAVSNEARQPGEADAYYQRILTECWSEASRILKPGGILAFTFHHSEDEPWVGVLESLFDAGFYLEATYPIRSDETKGEGEFGSKKIEYDIIHVCRKRLFEPESISWARLRRLILDDVQRIKILLSQHQKDGLPAADLKVIKRGKALEYFSRHYGKVYIEQGREFTIREALVGINQLIDDDTGNAGGPEAPPPNAEPYTRQFFRLFYEVTEIQRDQMQKFLRGTGIAPSDFVERGWCSEKNKVFTFTPPIELARAWKGASRKGMARDFDQTMFLVGGCFEGSNIRIIDTLDSPNFAPHPATVELVDWLISHGGSPQIKIAAQRAQTIYRDWLSRNKAKAQEQLSLFDLES
jgi:adenine-specific DNA methylase